MDNGRRWNDDATAYPTSTIAVLYVGLKDTAYDWLQKHKPRHWALPMFGPQEELDKIVTKYGGK